MNRDFYLKLAAFTFTICFLMTPIKGQTKKPFKNKTSNCTIGTTTFQCPEDFTKEQVIDDNTILFKRNYNSDITYFFAAISEKEFDDTKVRNIIAAKISGKSADGFRWKDVAKPLIMTLETKYEKKIINRLGYDNNLINFVSRYFEFNGKTIVLGYGYNTDNDGLVKLFERGEGIGDSALGCNAIATILNSITKEKKEKMQHCYLQGFSASE